MNAKLDAQARSKPHPDVWTRGVRMQAVEAREVRLQVLLKMPRGVERFAPQVLVFDQGFVFARRQQIRELFGVTLCPKTQAAATAAALSDRCKCSIRFQLRSSRRHCAYRSTKRGR